MIAKSNIWLSIGTIIIKMKFSLEEQLDTIVIYGERNKIR